MSSIDADFDIPGDAEVQTKWAPLYLQPIPGSGERLVVGLVVQGDGSWHVRTANQLRKLECLYGADAKPLHGAISTVVKHLTDAQDKIGDGRWISPVTGFNLGSWSVGEGASIEELGDRWLDALSSLHQATFSLGKAQNDLVRATASVSRSVTLRFDVYDLINRKRPNLSGQFSKEVRDRKQRARAKAQPMIDYRGDQLTANIEDLVNKSRGNVVSLMKQRLWDLSAARDRAKQSSSAYEMLVCSDISMDPNQRTDLIGTLFEQADERELRLREFSNAAEICDHIIEVEAA